MTTAELYECLEQNKENIPEEEKAYFFRELLKMLFADEYRKMLQDIIGDMKSEIWTRLGELDCKYDIMNIIDKHIMESGLNKDNTTYPDCIMQTLFEKGEDEE